MVSTFWLIGSRPDLDDSSWVREGDAGGTDVSLLIGLVSSLQRWVGPPQSESCTHRPRFESVDNITPVLSHDPTRLRVLPRDLPCHRDHLRTRDPRCQYG